MALTSIETLNATMAYMSQQTGMSVEELSAINGREFNALVANFAKAINTKPMRSDEVIEPIIQFKSQISNIMYVKRHYVRASSIGGGGVSPEIHTKYDPYLLLKYYHHGALREFTLRPDLKDTCTPSLYNQLLAVIEDIIEMPIEEFTEGTIHYE